MAFCTYCGAKLNDGEVCACQQPAASQPVNENPYAAPTTTYYQTQSNPYQTQATSTYQSTNQYQTYTTSNSSQTTTTYSTPAKILSIVSFVTGILGTVLCWGSLSGSPFFLLCSIAAIVTRSIARKKGTTNLAGMGTAGFALGIVGTVLGSFFYILYFAFGAAF